MLSRSNRVSTKQFNEVMKGGRVIHSTFFLARVAPSPDMTLRIATVAPVKVAKKAVIRNRVRRRLYEVVRKLSPLCEKAAHLILIAKASVLEAPIPDITEDIKSIFVKAGLLR